MDCLFKKFGKKTVTAAVASVGDHDGLDGGHCSKVHGPPRPRLTLSAGAAAISEDIVRVAVHSVTRVDGADA